jgi:dUTP pyrophosphatase
MLKVKIKKLHPDAVIPKYAKPGDAGLDLVAIDDPELENYYGYVEYRTGLAIEIPEGYVGLIYPRSSISNVDLTLTNSVGVIDSGYRGEIRFRFKVTFTKGNKEVYKRGDKIGQLIIMPYPKVELEQVEELSDSVRGSGAFGSSGA